LNQFFGQVFQRHTTEEAEEIFIVGTKKTTPSLAKVVSDQVQPWLFSRVLLFTLAAGLLLAVVNSLNGKMGDQVAMDVVLSVAVPASALVLFFEANVFKNISFYQVTKIAILGGALALIVVLVLDKLFPVASLDLFGVLVTGIVEETSKVLVASYFVRKLNISHVFNGLLLGAAVGTGFAAFENIQFMITDSNQLVSMEAALFRTATSISDHTEWCAIATAALVLAKGNQPLRSATFWDYKFLRFFGLVILIHMCWDWSAFDTISILRYIILAIITWVTVFVMIHAGLREVKKLQQSLDVNEASVTAPDEKS
jgi:RsiW-degrading membrane proteinase PrsW (M82 family)